MENLEQMIDKMKEIMTDFNADQLSYVYDLKDGYRLTIKLQNPSAVSEDERELEELEKCE